MTVAEPGSQAPFLYLLGPDGNIVAQYLESSVSWRDGVAFIDDYTVERGGTHPIVATSR